MPHGLSERQSGLGPEFDLLPGHLEEIEGLLVVGPALEHTLPVAHCSLRITRFLLGACGPHPGLDHLGISLQRTNERLGRGFDISPGVGRLALDERPASGYAPERLGVSHFEEVTGSGVAGLQLEDQLPVVRGGSRAPELQGRPAGPGGGVGEAAVYAYSANESFEGLREAILLIGREPLSICLARRLPYPFALIYEGQVVAGGVVVGVDRKQSLEVTAGCLPFVQLQIEPAEPVERLGVFGNVAQDRLVVAYCGCQVAGLIAGVA